MQTNRLWTACDIEYAVRRRDLLIMEEIEMWILLILSGLSSCVIMVLIFGLLGAGRKADEEEQRILRIISSELPKNTVTVSAQMRHAPLSSKIFAVK